MSDFAQRAFINKVAFSIVFSFSCNGEICGLSGNRSNQSD